MYSFSETHTDFLRFVLVSMRDCLFQMLVEHGVRSKGLEVLNISDLKIVAYLVTGLTFVLINALMFVDMPVVADF